MQVKIKLSETEVYDLYDDFGWLVDFEEMEAPSPKTNYVDIPGRSGYLDLTEVDGTVYFDAIVFTLSCKRLCRTTHEILNYTRQMINLFNGRSAQIFLDGDTYYYDGRISIGNYYRDSLVLGMEMNVTAYPYRLASEDTVETFTVNGTRNVTLSNDVVPVVPTITTTAAMTIVFNGTSYSVPVGEGIILPNLVLPSGDSELTLTGNGDITFVYQKGMF